MTTIDPVRVGAEFERLPLHITVVPPFYPMASRTEQLRGELEQKIADIGQFRVMGIEEDNFGPNHDIRVRKLGGSLLYLVHDKLLPIAKKFDRNMDLKNSGFINYDPHVTFINDKCIDLGERIEVSRLTLAQRPLPEDNWQILDNFPLKPRTTDVNWR